MVAEHIINHLDIKKEILQKNSEGLDLEHLAEVQESHFWRHQAKLRAQGEPYVDVG